MLFRETYFLIHVTEKKKTSMITQCGSIDLQKNVKTLTAPTQTRTPGSL